MCILHSLRMYINKIRTALIHVHVYIYTPLGGCAADPKERGGGGLDDKELV